VKALDRFEAACERLVEGSVGRLFRSRVQPAEIGRKLEKAMAAEPVVSVDGVIVPNDFAVKLHPADFAGFAAYASSLGRQLEAWLAEVAAERGWRLVDRVRVEIGPDEGVRRREIGVTAVISTVPGSAPDALNSAPRPPLGAVGANLSRGVRLRVLNGPQQGHEVLVRPPAGTVGRAPDNDVVLLAEDVSRHHARIEVGRGGARVVDLGSTNGTTLNGRDVTDAGFGPGDRLAFGSIALEVLPAIRERRPR